MPDPYAGLDGDRTLRDRLALDRTVLALLAGGIALLQFADHALAHVAGWAALPLAAVVFGVGVVRFRGVRQRLGG